MEKIMTYDDYKQTDVELPEEMENDLGVLQYLYYDFQSELDDSVVSNVYYGNNFKDVRENVEHVLKKYNLKDNIILEAFEPNFDDWRSFYFDVRENMDLLLKDVC